VLPFHVDGALLKLPAVGFVMPPFDLPHAATAGSESLVADAGAMNVFPAGTPFDGSDMMPWL
jgi:hypothetical protein